MAKWTFDDGSELSSGGAVRGAGEAARLLRMDLAEGVVRVGPPPMEPIPLDVKSNYLLDLLALDIAACTHQRVRTDYEAREEDMPEAVREIRRMSEQWVYGTVF
jgi:hypothetical protein